MIRMVQSTSAAEAKSYYSSALSKSDYYLEDQELGGSFHGKLAARLGLSGAVTKELFFALCENRHPTTGAKLTPRTKTERRVGYDINFHVPKSVSIVHVLSNDDHILEAFRSSVAETMRIIETDCRTRIRKGGAQADRITSEMLWVDFIHQTARPTKGFAPDPHLHAHCYAFNVTWDEVEKRYKAGEFAEIKRRMPLYQAMFQKKLADKLIAAGYRIRRTEKAFEIAGVPQRAIDHFSKRTDEIGQVAKEKGITDAKELDALGARTRARKQKNMSMGELKAEWRRQIRELEAADENSPQQDTTPGKGMPQGKDDPSIRYAREEIDQSSIVTAQDCAEHALQDCFERYSVVPLARLQEHAFRHAIGIGTVTLEDIADCLARDPRLIQVQEKRRVLCTTREVLAEEKRMVGLARDGQGKLPPLYIVVPELKLDGQQKTAVQHILTNRDRVSIIRGAAGTGKTTLMKEAVEKINDAGRQVMVVSPKAQTARTELRQQGYEQADTVARLLVDQDMQKRLQGQVLWVDEAGLLGVKDMAELIGLATAKEAKLVLSGDTRQHASVIRGDALRILSTVGGIQPAEVSKIYRQKSAVYKSAVEDLSKGDVRQGFEKLDRLGFVQEVDPMQGNERLVEDYTAAVLGGKRGLVISPTHEQGEIVNQAIRERLKAEGLIDDKETAIYSLVNRNLTAAEKSDWRNYDSGQVVQFNQNARHFVRGSRWTVDRIEAQEILVRNDEGKQQALPRHQPDRFDVYRLTEIDVAKGDRVRITKNGFDQASKSLNNGQIFDVVSVSEQGQLQIRSSVSDATYTIDRNFGHIAHAHCVTSQFSQGTTVDQVFISQPAATFGATNAKQFYVSVSRAREGVSIYTDDKKGLLDRASELGDRQSALELVAYRERHMDYVLQLQRKQPEREMERQDTEKDRPIDKTHDREEYEPAL